MSRTPEGAPRGPEQLAEPRHHRAEIVYGLVAFGVGLLLASQLGSELSWQPGTIFVRQPGFVATLAVAGMLVFGAFELFFAWRRNASGRGESMLGEIIDWLRAAEYAAWFMAYVLIVPNLGYLPTTLAFCLSLTLRLGYRNGRTLGAALLVGLATVIVFKGFLSVKIPGGAFYELLPDGIRNIMILYM
ncbi:MAG: tripartite tricarboxylate transporter TctB family protein [Hyphomicrobiaceae bacterium]